jgi:hypothetical protein
MRQLVSGVAWSDGGMVVRSFPSAWRGDGLS